MFGSAVLARCADQDRNGDVARTEWDALVLALRRADDTFDVEGLKQRLVLTVLDADGDGTATRAELTGLHAAADRDGDTIVQRSESGGRGQRGDALGGFVRTILFRASDADGDRNVTRAEWDAWTAQFPAEGALPAAAFAPALAAAERAGPDPDDRPGAVTPGVFLLTIASDLDASGDGQITAADLARIHRTLDANKDGDLAAAELRPARAPRPGARGDALDLEARRALPPQMPWQRNLDDALALSKATGKPLLICVNMDGESACEQLAWGRYRDPEFGALADGFICVVASPDRRNPADHDDRGRRLPDRRFGRIVNQEHIAIEPQVFERYFRNNRVAPRHVGVAPDGTILFDIFLTSGLEPIDQALREHGKPEPKTAPAASLTEAQLLASPDASHRDELERRFLAADAATRARLAAAALAPDRATVHPELVRLALRDPDAKVHHAGLLALAAHPAPATPDLLVEALRQADPDPALLAKLCDAVEAWAKPRADDTQAKTLLQLARGLRAPSKLLDVASWSRALSAARPMPALDADALDAKLSDLDGKLKVTPDDGALRLALAETTLQFAFARQAQGQDPGFLFQDAQAAAKRALANGAPAHRAHGYLAWSSYLSNDLDTALEHAEQALPGLAAEADTPLAAAVLDTFASCRLRKQYSAMTGGDEWPATWIADLRAAYTLLLALPGCTEQLATTALEWAATVQARAAYGGFADAAIRRFPLSVAIQAHGRAALLEAGGADGLLAGFAALQVPGVDAVTWNWYGALAAFVAAEQEVANRDADGALAAYVRAIQEFGAAIDARPDFGDSSRHYIALGQASRARLLAERGEWDQARDAAVAGLLARPGSATQKDGLNRSPIEHAGFVRQELLRAGRAEDAQRIEAAAREAGATLPGAAGGR